MKYQNRITGTGEEPLDQIMFNPRNWRIHPLHQQDALKGVLEEVGWVQQVIVNQRTGNLIDGHLRCQLAARESNETIPVTYVDLSDKEEMLILSVLDPIAGMAATDKEKLDDLFQQFNSDNENVQKLIGEIAEKEKLEFGKKPIEDVEPQIDKAEELRVKWGVETGQMWKLGEHRIICGDCTDKAVVDRLMGVEKAIMTFIDPPYNALKSWNKDEAHGETRLDPSKWFINDNMEWEEYWAFIDRLFEALSGHSVYVCCDYRIYPGIKSAIESKGYKTKHCIVWKKNVWGLGKRYRFQHEFIIYACKGDAPFYGGHDQSNVWEINIKKTTEHNTPKPVELPYIAIRNSSCQDEIIFDGCLGYGTSLIVCESLSRKCRAIEISPAYVAVSIQRWVDATSGTPELIT